VSGTGGTTGDAARTRTRAGRITALKSKLLSIGGDKAISDADLAEEIVDRRRS
jgi:hypothetical protein